MRELLKSVSSVRHVRVRVAIKREEKYTDNFLQDKFHKKDEQSSRSGKPIALIKLLCRNTCTYLSKSWNEKLFRKAWISYMFCEICLGACLRGFVKFGWLFAQTNKCEISKLQIEILYLHSVL
jgi:hypothetical protein